MKNLKIKLRPLALKQMRMQSWRRCLKLPACLALSSTSMFTSQEWKSESSSLVETSYSTRCNWSLTAQETYPFYLHVGAVLEKKVPSKRLLLALSRRQSQSLRLFSSRRQAVTGAEERNSTSNSASSNSCDRTTSQLISRTSWYPLLMSSKLTLLRSLQGLSKLRS